MLESAVLANICPNSSFSIIPHTRRLKFQHHTSLLNFNFKLWLQLQTSTLKLNFKLLTSNIEFNIQLKLYLQALTSNFNLKLGLQTNINLQLQIPSCKLQMLTQFHFTLFGKQLRLHTLLRTRSNRQIPWNKTKCHRWTDG